MDKLSTFEWYGQKLPTMEDLFDEVLHLIELGDPLLAMEFIDDYGRHLEEMNPGIDGRWVAKQNLGYFAGYFSEETATQVYEFFECEHPIFGRTFPTPEEAFEIGQKWGEAIKEGREFPPRK